MDYVNNRKGFTIVEVVVVAVIVAVLGGNFGPHISGVYQRFGNESGAKRSVVFGRGLPGREIIFRQCCFRLDNRHIQRARGHHLDNPQ